VPLGQTTDRNRESIWRGTASTTCKATAESQECRVTDGNCRSTVQKMIASGGRVRTRAERSPEWNQGTLKSAASVTLINKTFFRQIRETIIEEVISGGKDDI
jgi:hypothetical protein